MKKTILISGCLLGINCRYTGDGKQIDRIGELMEKYTLIPICPEQLGGLPTPRLPSERKGDLVIANNGMDVTEQFKRGAEEALKIAQLYKATTAVLKERSPSCGNGEIYDGSFSGVKIDGDGVTAELLKANGIRVIGESQIHELIGEV